MLNLKEMDYNKYRDHMLDCAKELIFEIYPFTTDEDAEEILNKMNIVISSSISSVLSGLEEITSKVLNIKPKLIWADFRHPKMPKSKFAVVI